MDEAPKDRKNATILMGGGRNPTILISSELLVPELKHPLRSYCLEVVKDCGADVMLRSFSSLAVRSPLPLTALLQLGRLATGLSPIGHVRIL